jgi:inhibitor of cysteine peptidase
MTAIMKRLCAAIALSAGLFLVSSCIGPSSYDLGYNDNGSTLKLNTGDTLTITLDGNPTTGYLWVFGAPFDPEMLVMTSESYSKPEGPKGMVGVPVKKTMTFKAFNAGRTGIQLEYRRPWERNEKPIKTFEVLVEISGEPLDGKLETEETPRRGSDGKVPEDPAKKLFGK